MKKIWILSHYAVPPELGPWTRHYKFAENLGLKGYDVKIFAASTIHNTDKNLITDNKKMLFKEFNGVEFIFIKACNYMGNGKKRIKNMLDYTFRVMSAAKEFETEKPDVIYASSAHPLTWISGYRLAKKYNAKFVAETRDLWPESLVAMGELDRDSIPAKILYKLEKFIYKKAYRLVFTFPGGKDYVDNIGVDSSKVRYINNGIDLDEFNSNKTKYNLDHKELNNEQMFKVVYTGSMCLANSLNYLLESAKIIKERGVENIQFLLYGNGYEKQQLEEYAKMHGLTNVIFMGKVEKKFIPYILSKSDLNIFTGKNISLYKLGLSLNKMFEYFASGKPTLKNIECGYDIFEEYKCGTTVKGGSGEALADGILDYYYMQKDEYNRYCENALIASKDFDFKILTEKFEEAIS